MTSCISSHVAPRRLPLHPRGRWGSSPSSPNCLLALRTLSCACPFLGQAKASLVWEVGIRKVGAGPPLDPVTSVVGPVWMPAEACHAQNSFVLLTFQQTFQPNNRHANRAQLPRQSLPVYSPSGRENRGKGAFVPTSKAEALFTEVTSCLRQPLSPLFT